MVRRASPPLPCLATPPDKTLPYSAPAGHVATRVPPTPQSDRTPPETQPGAPDADVVGMVLASSQAVARPHQAQAHGATTDRPSALPRGPWRSIVHMPARILSQRVQRAAGHTHRFRALRGI